MHVEELRLINYRNFKDKRVRLGPGLNLVTGKNGCGKTNLIEAIFLVSTGRPQRSSQLKEVIRYDQPYARVEIGMTAQEKSTEIALSIDVRGTSQVKAGGATYERKKKGTPIPSCLFSPDHLKIVKGSPEERRDLLDVLLAQVSPQYGHHRMVYGKVLRERNAALQRAASGKMGADVVTAFDEQLIASGSELVKRRAELVERMSPLVEEEYRRMSGDTAAVCYISQLHPSDDVPRDFAERLRERRKAEAARGLTLVGPHRDDIRIELDGHDMRAFASQGEQRTACLSIKLAESRVLEEVFHVKPILLLDDVMSELDVSRRRALMKRVLEGGQALITSTNREYFSPEEMAVARVIELE